MTHASVDHDQLQAAIKDLLSRKFNEVEILSVAIEEDVDRDEDDEGVEITVTFRGTTDQLVRGRPPGMFEMVRGQLAGLRFNAFPVFNFVSAA